MRAGAVPGLAAYPAALPAPGTDTHGLIPICTVAVVVAIAVAVLLHRRRRRRQIQAAAAWHTLITGAARDPGAHLCTVEHVYQYARRGSKAIIVWADTGIRQDAWFWHCHPVPGTTLLVRGGSRYGPHNRNPHVLYVAAGGVLAAAPPDAHHAYQQTRARALPPP